MSQLHTVNVIATHISAKIVHFLTLCRLYIGQPHIGWLRLVFEGLCFWFDANCSCFRRHCCLSYAVFNNW